jgi:signal transduction histidine kinase
VIKHAGPAASAGVTLSWQPGALAVDVVDDGRGAGALAEGPGHGLVGMRERAAAYGGTVAAGPRPGGGFAVRAVIPVLPVAAVVA